MTTRQRTPERGTCASRLVPPFQFDNGGEEDCTMLSGVTRHTLTLGVADVAPLAALDTFTHVSALHSGCSCPYRMPARKESCAISMHGAGTSSSPHVGHLDGTRPCWLSAAQVMDGAASRIVIVSVTATRYDEFFHGRRSSRSSSNCSLSASASMSFIRHRHFCPWMIPVDAVLYRGAMDLVVVDVHDPVERILHGLQHVVPVPAAGVGEVAADTQDHRAGVPSANPPTPASPVKPGRRRRPRKSMSPMACT